MGRRFGSLHRAACWTNYPLVPIMVIASHARRLLDARPGQNDATHLAGMRQEGVNERLKNL
jgi:hypothetical protein